MCRARRGGGGNEPYCNESTLRQGCPSCQKKKKAAGLQYPRASAKPQSTSNCGRSPVNRRPLAINYRRSRPYLCRLSVSHRRLPNPATNNPRPSPVKKERHISFRKHSPALRIPTTNQPWHASEMNPRSQTCSCQRAGLQQGCASEGGERKAEVVAAAVTGGWTKQLGGCACFWRAQTAWSRWKRTEAISRVDRHPKVVGWRGGVSPP